MSKFEQLKEKIILIHEEAARQKAAEEEALLKKQEEQRQALERELALKKLVEDNWRFAREDILETLNELNREVLEGRGKVMEQKQKNTGVHTHSFSRDISGGDSPSGATMIETYTYKATADVIDLRVETLGKISVFRLNDYREGDCNGKNFSSILYEEEKRKVFIGIFTSGMKYEILCPECEGVISLSLTQAPGDLNKQIEGAISEKLIALHERAVLW